jgi:N-ethylmaleimide reductase
VRELAPLQLAYLHLLHLGDETLPHDIRAGRSTALLVNRPRRARTKQAADITPVEKWALATPDLPERMRTGASLNTARPGDLQPRRRRGLPRLPKRGRGRVTSPAAAIQFGPWSRR